MSRRLLGAAYWLLASTVALAVCILTAIPFTGGLASAVGTTAAASVLIAALLLEPRRKGNQ